MAWRIVPQWELCSVYMIMVSLFIPLRELRSGATTGMNSYLILVWDFTPVSCKQIQSEKWNEFIPERKSHRYHMKIPYQRGRRMPFFFNRTQPQDYMKASKSSKTSVPGDNFSAKICNCINDHYVVGELYSCIWNLLKTPAKLRKSKGARYVQMAAKVLRWIESNALSLIKRPSGIKVNLNFHQLV